MSALDSLSVTLSEEIISRLRNRLDYFLPEKTAFYGKFLIQSHIKVKTRYKYKTKQKNTEISQKSHWNNVKKKK